MKAILFFSFMILLQWTASGQTITCKVIDSTTKQPVSAVTVGKIGGGVITFSNSDGIFELLKPDTTGLSISCLGYATCNLPAGSLLQDTIIALKPLIYSLPPVFVGDYAGNLLKAAFRKADSSSDQYFHAQGFELQFAWVDGKPEECYEFLQNEKISAEGLEEREIIAARHGVIPTNEDIFPLEEFRSMTRVHNWYAKSADLKSLLKTYNFEITKMIRMDSAVVAQIHFTEKRPSKRGAEEGYYYIDTATHVVVRYELDYTIPYISILGIAKIYDMHFHAELNYSSAQPFAPLANSSVSMSMTGTNHSGSQRMTLRFYEKAYHTQLVPWKNNFAFKPTPFHVRNSKAFKKFGNGKWDTNLPVKLSAFEQAFLQEMEKAGAFR